MDAVTVRPATRQQGIDALDTLTNFLSRQQYATMRHFIASPRCEEYQHFIDTAMHYAARVAAMPVTYQQDGKGEEAVVYLHYFRGGADCFITEKDSDPDGEGQVQAFGLADLFRDGGEMGYIYLPEWLEAGAEMDLFWTPKTLRDVRKARGL